MSHQRFIAWNDIIAYIHPQPHGEAEDGSSAKNYHRSRPQKTGFAERKHSLSLLALPPLPWLAGMLAVWGLKWLLDLFTGLRPCFRLLRSALKSRSSFVQNPSHRASPENVLSFSCILQIVAVSTTSSSHRFFHFDYSKTFLSSVQSNMGNQKFGFIIFNFCCIFAAFS